MSGASLHDDQPEQPRSDEITPPAREVAIPVSVLHLDEFKAMGRRLAEAESVIDELQVEVSDLAEENDRFRKALKTLHSELEGLLP